MREMLKCPAGAARRRGGARHGRVISARRTASPAPLNAARTSVVHRAVAALLVYTILFQPVFAAAATLSTRTSHTHAAALSTAWKSYLPAFSTLASGTKDALGYVGSFFGSTDAASPKTAEPAAIPAPTPDNSITDAAISRDVPEVNSGHVQGSMRVFAGKSFSLNYGTTITGDLYVVGTPTLISTHHNSTYGGTVADGGAASPSGYKITLNNQSVISGKIRTCANALPLPSDIPTSVTTPNGTRTVNIDTAADVSAIGNWSTLLNLNVNVPNLVINVPPGNYGRIGVNAASRLNFTTGVYNFSDTLYIGTGSSIQSTGTVIINVGGSFDIDSAKMLLGTNTKPGDVRLNILGKYANLFHASELYGLVRAVNAHVHLNHGSIVHGQVIADVLHFNNDSRINGDVSVSPPPDTQSPQLAITAPANNATLTTATVDIAGTASDTGVNASGVASVEVNGSSAVYNAATGTWSLSGFSLALGSNTLTARAIDRAGNATTQSITVVRQNPADTTAPQIAITSPADRSTTQSPAVTLTGTVSDPQPYPSGVRSVSVNGTDATIDSETATWTLAGVPLNLGVNTFTARAVDNAGNASTASVTITREPTPDTTPPQIAIDAPPQNTTEAAINLSGTAADSGLNQSGIAHVYVGDVEVPYNPQTGTWTTTNPVPLNLGVNTLTARAIDAAGNQATAIASVTRQEPPDTTPPTLAITSPTNGAATEEASIAVSGTVSDTGANASGVAQVTVNGQSATLNAAAGTWTTSVTLALGANQITARAVDVAGNSSAPVSINITRQQPDTQPPALTITSPSNGSTTTSATITVTGTTIDIGANPSGVAHVYVNDMEATLDAVLGTWTIYGVSLNNIGPNPINARAVDNAGNISTQSITITRTPPPDTTAPGLSISSPADGSTTEAENTTVTGTVSDPGEYASGVRSVTVNGAPATLDAQNGAWTLSGVALIIGANSITVDASDNAGNHTTQTVRLTRVPPPDTIDPVVTITSPSNNFISPDATITVTGTAIDEGLYATGIRHVIVNGLPATYNPTTHEWTATGVQLNEGANLVRVIAEDAAPTPNRAEAFINVTLRTPDTQPPTIVILSPQMPLETYDASVNVSGTASDDGLNAAGIQSIKVNGLDANFNAATGAWSLANLPLSYGDNRIVVVAVDKAPTQNQGNAEIHVTRNRIPAPQLTISNPQNGAVLAATSLTLAGNFFSLSTQPVAVTVNGEAASVSGGRYTKVAALSEGTNTFNVVATDALGQQAQASVSVVRDLTPPDVTFIDAPSTVQPGGTYQINVQATDNIGVADVEFRLDGEHVAVSAASPYQFTLTVPSTFAAGNTLVLSAIARDLSGSTSVATAQARTTGPGGISGYVFDDATGYILGGVRAVLNGQTTVTTDETGAYSLISSTPTGVVRLSKEGYTPVERLYTVTAFEGTALFDARLTPFDGQSNQITSAGGTATGDGGRLQVSFAPEALAVARDMRVTSLSPQGLANLLPYGWSPVPGAVVDVRPFDAVGGVSFQTPAHLHISQTQGLSSSVPLVLAHYDEARHGWTTVATDLAAGANGALDADLPAAGQYAFLVADTNANAPAAPVAGQPLTSSRPADSASLDAATATAVAMPRTANYSAAARSTINFVATAPTQLPSGVAIEATFGETYKLLGGRDAALVDRPAQDFVLYSYPAASIEHPNRLAAFFIAKPTRTEYSITELLSANVHVEIRSGRQTKTGVLIGTSGGTLRASNGAQLTIPANAVSSPQPVYFNDVQNDLAAAHLPEGYEVVAAFDVDLTNTTLSGAASISAPPVAGDVSRIVLARLVTVGGQRAPKVVARAIEENGRLVSTVLSPAMPAGVALSGITVSGRYVFIRVPQAFGYATGIVTDGAGGTPARAVKVSTEQTPFIDVTGADGKFVVIGTAGAGAAGTNQVSAASLQTDATGKATSLLAAQDSVAASQIALTTQPLTVESVTPASGAQNMIVTTPVTVTFNKPIAASSLTGSTFTLATTSGNPVLANITVLAGNRVAVLTPAKTLDGSTAYRINISNALRDIYGKPLASPFSSTFTTAAIIKTDERLKPERLRINYPDANGISRVVIPAGAVPEGSLIIAVNEASASTVSTVAGTAAIELSIAAQVGDQITLIVRQPDGVEYRIMQAAYRRADGFTSVGSRGGAFTSEDGKFTLALTEGAIVGQANIKLEPSAEADITTPREGEMSPENVPYGGGVRVRAEGQFEMKKEAHLEVAVPAGVQVEEGRRVAFLQPSKLALADGTEHDVWETVTSGRVEGGRYKTTSPPFMGLWFVPGMWTYYIFIPRYMTGVHGVVQEQVPAGAPKPLNGVTVTIINGTLTNKIPIIVTKTNAAGIFGTFDVRVPLGEQIIVNARDGAGREIQAVAAPDINTNPYLTPGMDGMKKFYASVLFPPSDASGPESKPAVLRLSGRRLDLDAGQRDSLAEEGIVSVGTEIAVAADITPEVYSFSGRLLVNGSEGQTLQWQSMPAGADNPTGERRIATFRVPSQGSFSVVVETFTKVSAPATKARATYNFIGLSNPNVRPPLPGSPRVLSVTPPDKARQVDAGRRIHLEFSEPVKNLVAGTTIYLREAGTGRQLGGRLLSGGIDIGANSENISQLDFEPTGGLAGGKLYELHVTSEVKDTDGHALDQEQTSADDTSPQPFQSTFTTFAGLVLTDAPVTDSSNRLASAGQYAVTITSGRGSRMTVYDMSNPSTPTVVGNAFVPDWATSVAMIEVEDAANNFKVGNPAREFSRIAIVNSVPLPADAERPTNMWVYSLDDPATPEIIGVVSLSFESNITAIPSSASILGKRAYIAATPQGGTIAVDIEQAINQWAAQILVSGTAIGANHPRHLAIMPNTGFAKDAKRQTVTYGDSRSLTAHGSAAVNAVSAISQVVSGTQGAGLQQTPIAYITTPNKPYMGVLGFNEADDSRNGFYDADGNGRDDRVLTLWELEPVGYPRDVRARSNLQIKGRTMDIAVVLGLDRLWIFDATDPRNIRQYPSRTFADMGFDYLGYASRIDVEGTLAYVIFPDHVGVIDFSEPEHPARVATIASAGAGMKSISVKDGFIYTLSGSGLSVSIARPASQVIVHGLNQNDERICTNPVVLNRANRMTQPAGIYFQVFGSDMPHGAQVVIRRERKVGEQNFEETLATLQAQIDTKLSTEKVIVGRASWNPNIVIDRTWTYTAEVVFNEGSDSEYHARREPVPFSYLIAEAMRSFGSAGGKGSYSYVLGGSANVTLTVEGRNILEDAADPHTRVYGLNADLVRHQLADGVYPFTLRASLESNPSVTDEVEGEMIVANTPSDLRLPGNTVVSGVELQTGNLALSHADVEIPNRGLSLSLTRSYNGSASNTFGPFGYGWSHNLQVLLVHNREGRSYTMRGGDGGGQLFREDKESGGRIEAEDPHQGTLVKNPDGSFEYFTKAHVRYHFPGAMAEDDTNYFNLSYMGNLQYMEEPNGNRLTLTYDMQGRMTHVTDSSDRSLAFTYEQAETPLVGAIAPSGGSISCTNKGQLGLVRARFLRAGVGKAWRIIKMVAPGGLNISYEYDADGNLEHVTRSGEDSISTATSDYVWKYEYNPPSAGTQPRTHLIRSVTAPNDTADERRVTTYDYHFDLFRTPVKSISFPEGVTNTFAYTLASNLVTQAVVTDGRGKASTYAFDRVARTTTATRPRGARTVTAFNEKGQPTQQTDPDGAVTTTKYERGNPTSVTVAAQGITITTTTAYDSTFNKRISETDPNGHTTSYALDSHGNVTQITLPTGQVTRMEYAINGDLTSNTDQYGATTTYAYNAYGNQTGIRRAGGIVSTRAFDIRGRLLSSSGTLEPNVGNTYDALDNVIQTVTSDPASIRDESTVTYTYLPAGQLLTSTVVSGGQQIVTSKTYDGLDRVTRTTEQVNGAGSFTRVYTYDGNSNPLTETDRRGVTSTHTYDDLNFRTATVVSGSFGESKTTSQATLNLVGLPLTVTDVYGQQISLEYDGLRRIVKRTLPGGYTEETVYDGVGNITSSKDLNGRVTTTRYDEANRAIDQRDAAGRTTTWVYDDSTRAVTVQHEPQGLAVITQHDAVGRVLSEQVRFNGGDYTTRYVYEGLTVRVTDPRGIVTTKKLSAFGETGNVSVAGADPAYSTEARYTGLGGLKSRKDGLGQATAVTLDGFNRALQISHPGGLSESFAYDGAGNTLSHTDRRGVVTETTYDNLSRPLATKVTGGGQSFAVNTVVYDDAGVSERHTDARGNFSVLKYDGHHRLTSVTNAAGKVSTLEYDGLNLIRQSDLKGQFTSYQYDSVDRLTAVTDPAGQMTTVAHSDSGGYTKKSTDRRGVQTIESYDALGRLKSVARGGETLYTFEYDADSNIKTRTDARGHIMAFTYDTLNRVKTINHAGTQTETFVYDANSNVLEHSDGAGGATKQTYDALNRPLTRTDGAGNTTQYKYDGEGLLLERTNPKGAAFKTAYEYNALGSLVKVTDAESGVWILTYDAAQNLTDVRDARGHTVSYVYDKLNRATEMRQPLGLTTLLDYDENSNLVSRRDPKNQETTLTYDKLNRPRTVSYANGGAGGPQRYEYDYDPEGRVTEIVETLPGSARHYARTYDTHGRLQTATDQSGYKVSYGYDAADNMTSLVDASGRQTAYAYDAANRLQSVGLPGGGQVSYTWRADGLVSQIDYGSQMRRDYRYDDADRLTGVVNTLGAAQSEEYAYTYDANSNRLTETKSFNGAPFRTVAYTYDTLDRLTNNESSGIVTTQGLKGEYFDNPDLTELKQTRTDAKIDFSWPALSSPDPSIDSETFSVRWTGQITPLYTEQYTFHTQTDEGVRLWVDGQLLIDNWGAHTTTEDAGTIALQGGRRYDIKLEYYEQTGDAEARLMWSSARQSKEIVPPSRLISSSSSVTSTLQYVYDAVGNRTAQTSRDVHGAQANLAYTYDDLNRLTTLTGSPGGDIAYSYDNNGNLTSTTQAGQLTAQYEYDVRDQLRRVLNGTSQEVASYDYDHERRRTGKRVAGLGSTRYVYDGMNVISEFNDANRLVNSYDYGTDIVRGELVGEGARFYFADAQGSVTALSAPAANPALGLTRYEYDAWGEVIGNSGGSGNAVGYTGQRRDAETGLMALGAGERYYSPGLGRFVQQDSWSGVADMAQSLNRYAYSLDNPLRYTDPSGNKPVEATGGRGFNIWQYRSVFGSLTGGKVGAFDLSIRRSASGEPQLVVQERETATTYAELQEQNNASGTPTGIRADMKREAYEYGMRGVNASNWQSRSLQNWVMRSGYDLWNILSFGTLEDNDTLVSDMAAGRISEQEYYEGRTKLSFKAVLSIASLGSGAVTGRLVGAVGTRYAAATTLTGRTAIGAGVAMGERYVFESAEMAVGLRREYSSAGSYLLTGGLGGLFGALTPSQGARNRAMGEESEGLSRNRLNGDSADNVGIRSDTPASAAPSSVNLNRHQRQLLEQLRQKGDFVELPKKMLRISDMTRLSAHERVEFALFTRGGQRILMRGDLNSVPFTPGMAKKWAQQGWRWSGHTHPVSGESPLVQSSWRRGSDQGVLWRFSQYGRQRYSAVYDWGKRYRVFTADEGGFNPGWGSIKK
jgi:RHS repeat-associated protein